MNDQRERFVKLLDRALVSRADAYLAYSEQAANTDVLYAEADAAHAAVLQAYDEARGGEAVAASAWWALVMGAAAALEDAAIGHRDPDARRAAEGAAKHYREAAKALVASPTPPAGGKG